MKKRMLLLLSMLMLAVVGYGDVTVYSYNLKKMANINQLDISYCEVVISGGIHCQNITAKLDYGEAIGYIVAPSQKKKSKRPKKLKFQTRVQVLNYMKKNGWELVAFTWATEDFRSNIYVFKKVNT